MITIKEEFVGGDKWRRAVDLGGSDAIVMWLALKCYAAQHLTGGFIPTEEMKALPGAPKRAERALAALKNCGRMRADGSRGSGLIEQKDLGWQLHDYDDHANSPAEEELRREKERLRKKAWRDAKAAELEALRASMNSSGQSRGTDGTFDGTVPRDNAGHLTGHVPGQSRGTDGTFDGTTDENVPSVPHGTRPRGRVRPPVRTQARVPNPTQPNQAEEAAAAPGLAAQPEITASRFPMCALWQPSTETVAGVEIAGVPRWAIDELVSRFRAHFLADPAQSSTSAEWNQRCAKWVLRDWRNPKTRPEKAADTDDTGGYGNAAEWG